MQDLEQQAEPFGESERPLVLPLSAVDAGMLFLVGGKGANLGELVRAGLPVPDGFCVTTAAYGLVSSQAGLEPLLEELGRTAAGDTSRLEEYAEAVRARLLEAAVPDNLVAAISEAYQAMATNEDAPVAVAVRSSATAEDLPFASFAGQQDTYLNVLGVEAVLDAVHRCWASLWMDRAVV